MSLDIGVYRDGEELVGLNWLRNPFGLCDWAEDNAHHNGLAQEKFDLYYVCNHWAYDNATAIDRRLFKEVVDRYGATLLKLDSSFYFFTLSEYRQFIQPHEQLLPGRIVPGTEVWSFESSFYDEQQRLAIPVDHFSHQVFNLGEVSTRFYQEWFQKLMQMADLLQDPDVQFSCSN